MARNYYCLVAGLPNLFLDDSKLSYDSNKFREELERELHPDDLCLFDYFRADKDNRNVINYLTGKRSDFIAGGTISEDELKDKIENVELLPEYLAEFVRSFKNESNTTPDNPELLLNSLFYASLLNNSNKFLKEWTEFELNVRNVFTALNCRKYNMEIKHEIVGDNWVAESIRKNNTRDFGLNELPYINQLLQVFESGQLMEREKALDLMRWNLMDEMVFYYYFSVERLFSYYWKISVVERWLGLDQEIGRQMFTKLLDDLKKSYEFPEELT